MNSMGLWELLSLCKTTSTGASEQEIYLRDLMYCQCTTEQPVQKCLVVFGHFDADIT